MSAYPNTCLEPGIYGLWDSHGQPGLTDNEIQAAISWLKTHGPFPRCSESLLKMGHLDMYTCLVPSFLPNLRSLTLNPICVRSKLLVPNVMRAGQEKAQSSSTACCTKLRKAQFGIGIGNRVQVDLLPRFPDLYSLLYYPLLEELTIELPSMRGFHSPKPEERPSLTHLTSLELPYCEATPNALEEVLSVKPPLRRLRYEFSTAHSTGYKGSDIYDLNRLSHALGYIRESLESLALAIDFGYNIFNTMVSEVPITGIFAPISNFAKLSDVKIPFVVLSGGEYMPYPCPRLSSILPAGVRNLCLVNDMVRDFAPLNPVERT